MTKPCKYVNPYGLPSDTRWLRRHPGKSLADRTGKSSSAFLGATLPQVTMKQFTLHRTPKNTHTKKP